MFDFEGVMGEKIVSTEAVGNAVPHESPLVPNRTIKRMYEGMVHSRLLEDLLRKRHGKSSWHNVRGQEACRVSALVDLDPEDFASDLPGGATTALLLGASPQAVLEHANAFVTRKKKDAFLIASDLTGLLPAPEDTSDRFSLALGAALTLKRLKLSKVVILFSELHEAKPSLWRKTLRFAAKEQLPLLFVVLPASVKARSKKDDAFSLSGQATAIGVPGIPVDASDAIALYRVAQESIGRARADGGPALMECTNILIEGEKPTVIDPIETLGVAILNRQICDQGWIDDLPSAFQDQIDAL